ncbi:acetyltransferase [Listeria kieliensis]|uniref:Sugar O-acyltransferase n=1 Tax=Listeria kieliensis TaxID=1621700 RepID=A0A3D8TKU9_9LIST|nr:acetyltransferase [Listeria kieliensis]RDW99444.1 sugar O-acyltransferase [Listeria kieliensis]
MRALQQNVLKVKKNLVIIGYGSQGRMLKNMLEQYDFGYRFSGFLDDQIEIPRKKGDSFEAPLEYSELLLQEDVYFILAIGKVEDRFQVVKRLVDIPLERYATLIHPFAYVDKTVEIGAGTYISANAAVMHGVKVGHHTSILTGSVIEYESQIGSFVNISPNTTLCGNVCINDVSFIGAGASIIQGLTVGKRSLVGAGATVIKDIAADSIALGTPAVVKSRKKEPTLCNVYNI